MADLTVTAANVVAGSEAVIKSGTAGATITAGQTLYKDSTDSNELKTASTSTAATAKCVGIALNGASDGQPIDYIESGDLNPGATVAVGEVYVVSDNAGGIAIASDNGAGDFVTILGVGTTTSNIKIKLNVSGIAHA